MARDLDALKLIVKWARTGDRSDPEDVSLVRSIGWPASFSPPGDDHPQREVFNQMFAELSALAKEINERGGILEYASELFYVQYARVMGSNGKIYRAKVSVTTSNTVDPVTDTSQSVWVEDVPAISDSSDTAKGLAQRATEAEVRAGADDEKFVSSATMRAAGDDRWAFAADVPDAPGSASQTSAGTVRFATNAEVDNGSSDVVVSPAGSRRLGDGRYVRSSVDGAATETKRGSVLLATSLEARNGTDTSKAMTPARTKDVIDVLIGGAPGALNTLNELAAALGDDAAYAATLTNSLALKAPLASPALTGAPTAPTPGSGNDSTRIATTAYVLEALPNLTAYAATALLQTPNGAKAPLALSCSNRRPAPKAAAGDDSTRIANTAWAQGELDGQDAISGESPLYDDCLTPANGSNLSHGSGPAAFRRSELSAMCMF